MIVSGITLAHGEQLATNVARALILVRSTPLAEPGQFFLLSRAAPTTAALLPHVLIPSWQDEGSGLVEAVWSGDLEPVSSMFAGSRPLLAHGPLGRPFLIQRSTRRAIVCSSHEAPAPALFLTRRLVALGVETTVLHLAPDRSAIAGELLPPEVEVELCPEQATFLTQLERLVQWADQLYLSVPEGLLNAVVNVLRRRLLRTRRGFAQVFVNPHALPCGVGACDLCTRVTRDGARRLCRDGLVFDLLSLI